MKKLVFATLAISANLFLMLGLSPGLVGNNSAAALSGSDFNPGRIIDDAVFFDGNAMNTSQIQAFLNAKLPECASGYTCLKDYRVNTPAKNPESGLCGAFAAKTSQSAAQIINDVAKSCGISPKVILVLLQKEMGLVTRTAPTQWYYDRATGYDCPDTDPPTCNPNHFGLFNQIYMAARVYKWYALENGPNYRKHQNNYIQYNPSASCGGSWVYIENQATAGLYNYTPYQPNPATLAVGLGVEAPCGAYGNKNFWWMFNNWFGSTYAVDITMEGYDLSTDKDGEEAKIGFRLNTVPTSDVYLDVAVHSGSNGKVIGSSTLRIPPENWNKPSRSFVRVSGQNNGAVTGTYENRLVVQRVTSKDGRYNNFPVNFIEFPGIVHQDTKSTPSVYRLYNSAAGKHMMTANKMDMDVLLTQGWRNDGSKFSYCYGGDKTIFRVSKSNDSRLVVAESDAYMNLLANGYSVERAEFTASTQGDVPVYWLFDAGRARSLYSISPTEGSASGFVNQGVAFNACSIVMAPVYQLYKPGGSRLYTSSARERNKALYESNYEYEGTGFYSCSAGTIDVYRLYKGGTGNRFYTVSASERDVAVNNIGYRYEGVGYKICAGSSRDVHRLYRGSDGTRFYTVNPDLRDRFVRDDGYRYEGVGYKVR